MKKRGYTLQNQVKDVTNSFAAEVGDKLAEHGFAYRHNVLMTEGGMRFVFEASINGQWPDDPLPSDWIEMYRTKAVPMPMLTGLKNK